ncbi:MAG: heme o synthase, partial [Actinomycetota bacterium]
APRRAPRRPRRPGRRVVTTRAVTAARGEALWATVADYVRLTKPRVISLLLVTTLCAMIAAAQGAPSGWDVLATMVGGYLAAGGANSVNQFVDRDIDARMGRTTGRPVVSGRITPARALVFGVACAAASVLTLGLAVNWVASALAFAGFLLYVFLYTLWLKRSTVHNIVIGGAAGAVPPMVGWAAVTGDVGLAAWLLFAIVFYWTPPHFWALALLLERDYADAGVPMLPVVRGEQETRRQVLLWTLVCVGVSLLPYAAGTAGLVYLVSAAALGALFLWYSARLVKVADRAAAKVTFHYSMLYLALLFAALVVDAVV